MNITATEMPSILLDLFYWVIGCTVVTSLILFYDYREVKAENFGNIFSRLIPLRTATSLYSQIVWIFCVGRNTSKYCDALISWKMNWTNLNDILWQFSKFVSIDKMDVAVQKFSSWKTNLFWQIIRIKLVTFCILLLKIIIAYGKESERWNNDGFIDIWNGVYMVISK